MAEQGESVKQDIRKRKFEGILPSQEALNLTREGTALIVEIPNGAALDLKTTFFNDFGLRLFTGPPEWVMYIDGVDVENQLPGGDNIDESDFRWSVHCDDGLNDTNNQVVRTWLQNNSGAQITLTYALAFRIIVEQENS